MGVGIMADTIGRNAQDATDEAVVAEYGERRERIAARRAERVQARHQRELARTVDGTR